AAEHFALHASRKDADNILITSGAIAPKPARPPREFAPREGSPREGSRRPERPVYADREPRSEGKFPRPKRAYAAEDASQRAPTPVREWSASPPKAGGAGKPQGKPPATTFSKGPKPGGPKPGGPKSHARTGFANRKKGD
ncbi:MAG: hypothetical protein ACRC7C_02990, partial [Beijerinckiaceae bacterium]